MRYLGCKNKLLDNIESGINENCKDCVSFCDIFSGTGTVAEYFKTRYSIISNDYLYFSYVIQCAKLLNNKKLSFEKLRKIISEDPLDYLDNINEKNNKFDESLFFIKNNYSDFGNRPYLTSQNAEKVDKWRHEQSLLRTMERRFDLFKKYVRSHPDEFKPKKIRRKKRKSESQ